MLQGTGCCDKYKSDKLGRATISKQSCGGRFNICRIGGWAGGEYKPNRWVGEWVGRIH